MAQRQPKVQGQIQGLSPKGWQLSNGHILAKAVRDKLDKHGLEFLDALVDLAKTAIDERVRLAALIHLLDRQIGRAPEAITINHKMEIKAAVANITPDVQAKLTDVISALKEQAKG